MLLYSASGRVAYYTILGVGRITYAPILGLRAVSLCFYPPRGTPWREGRVQGLGISTPNLPTNIVGFKGFDSSTILILRGGIPRFIGDFPESLTQAMLVGAMLVGGLGVPGLGLRIDPNLGRTDEINIKSKPDRTEPTKST